MLKLYYFFNDNFFQSFVRKSILFALSLLLIVIPDNQLLTGLNSYFIEMKYWLESELKQKILNRLLKIPIKVFKS
jgi:hypothetical protein